MTKLGFGGRDIFPMVSHATALDYFVLMCFWFTFATMIEYAAINYLQRYAIVTLNRLIKRRDKLRGEQEFLARLARVGVHRVTLGCFATILGHLILCLSLPLHLQVSQRCWRWLHSDLVDDLRSLRYRTLQPSTTSLFCALYSSSRLS